MTPFDIVSNFKNRSEEIFCGVLGTNILGWLRSHQNIFPNKKPQNIYKIWKSKIQYKKHQNTQKYENHFIV